MKSCSLVKNGFLENLKPAVEIQFKHTFVSGNGRTWKESDFCWWVTTNLQKFFAFWKTDPKCKEGVNLKKDSVLRLLPIQSCRWCFEIPKTDSLPVSTLIVLQSACPGLDISEWMSQMSVDSVGSLQSSRVSHVIAFREDKFQFLAEDEMRTLAEVTEESICSKSGWDKFLWWSCKNFAWWKYESSWKKRSNTQVLYRWTLWFYLSIQLRLALLFPLSIWLSILLRWPLQIMRRRKFLVECISDRKKEVGVGCYGWVKYFFWSCCCSFFWWNVFLFRIESERRIESTWKLSSAKKIIFQDSQPKNAERFFNVHLLLVFDPGHTTFGVSADQMI